MLDGTSKNQLGYIDFSGFGGVIASAGTTSPFSFGGGNGSQTEADTGPVMMGHRYYDPRTGRFITQDPAHDGRNWYAYANNNPVNNIDPSGLSTGAPGTTGAPDQRYGGFWGSDPGGLFGERGNTDGFQTGAGQGSAQQTQGLGFSTGLILPSGVLHPPPIIINDGPGYDWFQAGIPVFSKEARMWINANKFKSQGGARYGIAANAVFIAGGISYIGNPASGGVVD